MISLQCKHFNMFMYSAFMCNNSLPFYVEIGLPPTILYDRDGCKSSDTLYARQNLHYEVEQLLEEAFLEANFDQDWLFFIQHI